MLFHCVHVNVSTHVRVCFYTSFILFAPSNECFAQDKAPVEYRSAK
jgi:hypothetical protein